MIHYMLQYGAILCAWKLLDVTGNILSDSFNNITTSPPKVHEIPCSGISWAF